MAKLSIVVPVYNEVNTIEQIVSRISALRPEGLETEIIIIDDFSTDGTTEKLKRISATDKIKVLFHEKNKGKGASLRTGFKEVSGDYVIIQDADLEYDPEEYPLLLRPLIDDKADVVFGSRFVGAQPHRVLLFWHYAGNKLLTLFSNMLTNLNLTDMETCYKAFKAQILKKISLKENRFGFEPEFTAKVAKRRFRIFEVGISYYGRGYGEGKKIGWKDGFRALWCIIKYRIVD